MISSGSSKKINCSILFFAPHCQQEVDLTFATDPKQLQMLIQLRHEKRLGYIYLTSQRSAAPRRIQCSGGCTVLRSTAAM